MIETILNFLGYMKIKDVPVGIVQLSMMQEGWLERFIEQAEELDSNELANDFKRQLRGQKAITEYLRSLRLLRGETKSSA